MEGPAVAEAHLHQFRPGHVEQAAARWPGVLTEAQLAPLGVAQRRDRYRPGGERGTGGWGCDVTERDRQEPGLAGKVPRPAGQVIHQVAVDPPAPAQVGQRLASTGRSPRARTGRCLAGIASAGGAPPSRDPGVTAAGDATVLAILVWSDRVCQHSRFWHTTHPGGRSDVRDSRAGTATADRPG